MLTSLTSQDLKNIGKVVEKVVDEKLDKKFDEKLEPVMEMLTNIFDDLQGKHEKIKKLDKRIDELESIHPDNCHQPALL